MMGYPSSVGMVHVRMVHALTTVRFEADFSEVKASLESMGLMFMDPPEGALKAAAEELVSGVIEEFQTAGGGDWEPLAESTLAKRRGTEAQILVDTARFRNSIEPLVENGEAAAVTDVEYAVYHVSSEPRYVIPLRNPFDVAPEVIDAALAILVEAIVAEAFAGDAA
jgi:phage gpG-like protein